MAFGPLFFPTTNYFRLCWKQTINTRNSAQPKSPHPPYNLVSVSIDDFRGRSAFDFLGCVDFNLNVWWGPFFSFFFRLNQTSSDFTFLHPTCECLPRGNPCSISCYSRVTIVTSLEPMAPCGKMYLYNSRTYFSILYDVKGRVVLMYRRPWNTHAKRTRN